ncbi:hypothetical protein HDV03_004933 [Kappamyces sp. JEL0829]|nr:hypothetical protein HDV03_004933 [Kappamyces sp. JEL0829]
MSRYPERVYSKKRHSATSSYNGTEIQTTFGGQYYSNEAIPSFPQPSGMLYQTYQNYQPPQTDYSTYQLGPEPKAKAKRPTKQQNSLSRGSREALIKKTDKRYSTDSVASRAGRERYCCGCFASKSVCVRTLCSTLVLFLIGVGVAVYFLWPRMPNVVVKDPTANLNSKSQLMLSSDTPGGSTLQTASASSPFTASIQLNIDISVFSPNYITYTFDNIAVTASLADPAGSGKILNGGTIGKGDSGRVSFPPNQNTTFTIPFMLQFSITAPLTSLNQNAQIYTLMQQCASQQFPDLPKPKFPGFIATSVKGSIVSKLISWTGIQPSFEKSVVIPCPQAATDFAQLLGSLK